MATTFNDIASPNVDTKYFKIYMDMADGADTESWELQGRGIASWTIEQNQDFTVDSDVLGYNDFTRGTPKPQQSVEIAIRKGSKLGGLLFDAFYSGDTSKLNSLKILQKFEMVDATPEGECKARVQEDCAININQFMGEAEGKLKFAIDIYYSNNITLGHMAKVDASPVTFTPDDPKV